MSPQTLNRSGPASSPQAPPPKAPPPAPKPRPRKRPPEDPAPCAPGWMVSFTDMVTLLLAFFVLLQSFAHERDPDLFFVGRGSFIRAIEGYGLPEWLLGRGTAVPMDYPRIKHSMESQDEPAERRRVLDADAERIAEAFERIRQNMDCEAADITTKVTRPIPTSLRFAQGGCTLDGAGRRELDQHAAEMAAALQTGSVQAVRVVAIAPSEPTPERQWAVSARRAAVVADALRQALRRHGVREPQVTSFGDGAGGLYADRFGGPGDPDVVVISVLKME